MTRENVGHERQAPDPDHDLLERCRQGDASAFDALVARHRLAVYRVARRVLGTHEDADEAAQETFVRAWRSLSRFRGDARVGTWLIRIAINVSRTIGAGTRHGAPVGDATAVPSGGVSADAAVAAMEDASRVRAAVASLPPRQREVVALKVFSDMTYEDVAAAMGISVGAAKAHFHQAVSNLRRRMGGGEWRG